MFFPRETPHLPEKKLVVSRCHRTEDVSHEISEELRLIDEEGQDREQIGTGVGVSAVSS